MARTGRSADDDVMSLSGSELPGLQVSGEVVDIWRAQSGHQVIALCGGVVRSFPPTVMS